jgi:3-phenylpropionate/trans-cinnamate dioxygenase ferredoxin subunit
MGLFSSHSWQKIAESEQELQFNNCDIAEADANGKLICIGRFNGKLFAFAHKCPHAGALMSEGYVDAVGNVVCPSHRYKFNMQNGRNVSGEGYYLKHWEVEVREDGVYVKL